MPRNLESRRRPAALPGSRWLWGAVVLGWITGAAIVLGRPVAVVSAWMATLPTIIAAAITVGWLSRRARRASEQAERPVRVEGRPSTAMNVSQSPPTDLLSGLGVLTDDEVARLLRVERSLLVAAIREGHVPGNQIAGHWRIASRSLEVWLDGRYRPPV